MTTDQDNQKLIEAAVRSAVDKEESKPETMIYNSRYAATDTSRKVTVQFDASRELYIYRGGRGHTGESAMNPEQINQLLQRKEENRIINTPRHCSAITRNNCR